MNKNNTMFQIANYQWWEAIVHSIASKDPVKPKPKSKSKFKSQSKPRSQKLQSEALPFMPAKDHHHIRELQHSHCDILAWVHEHKDSPCMKVR